MWRNCECLLLRRWGRTSLWLVEQTKLHFNMLLKQVRQLCRLSQHMRRQLEAQVCLLGPGVGQPLPLPKGHAHHTPALRCQQPVSAPCATCTEAAVRAWHNLRQVS